MTDELKPCKKCGRVPFTYLIKTDKAVLWFVACPNRCDCTDYCPTEEFAIAAWNRRAD